MFWPEVFLSLGGTITLRFTSKLTCRYGTQRNSGRVQPLVSSFILLQERQIRVHSS